MNPPGILTPIDLTTTCPKIGIFRYMDAEDWGIYKSYLEQVRYTAGDILYREGDAGGDFLAYIVSGHLEALKETEFLAKPVILAKFFAGSVVGEMAFIDGSHRSVSIKVIEDSELLIFTRQSHEKLLDEAPRVMAKLFNGISHLLSLRLRRANDRLATLF
jgi:CRP-like cAMP-binding protein